MRLNRIGALYVIGGSGISLIANNPNLKDSSVINAVDIEVPAFLNSIRLWYFRDKNPKDLSRHVIMNGNTFCAGIDLVRLTNKPSERLEYEKYAVGRSPSFPRYGLFVNARRDTSQEFTDQLRDQLYGFLTR